MIKYSRQFQMALISAWLASALACIQAGLCADQNSPADSPVFQVEQPKSESAKEKAESSGKKILHGGLHEEAEAYTKTPSNTPLLKGTVTQWMPLEWKGLWEGAVQLNELRGNATSTQLKGLAVDMALNLETAKNGSNIFNLNVHDLTGKVSKRSNQDEDPDIIYSHDGNRSNLLITNGASMHVGGSMVLSGGSMTIANGAHVVIGGPSSMSMSTSPQSPQNRMPSSDRSGNNVTYDNGAITATGPVEFHGKYFKSDDRLAMNGARIDANRIDLGNSTTYTNGHAVSANGNQQSGYLLSELSGAGVYVSPDDQAAVQQNHAVELIGSSRKGIVTEMLNIAPGIVDTKSISPLIGRDGTAIGSQQVVTRFTALSENQMMIQMNIENFDASSHLKNSFSASGYLHRHQ